MAATQKLLDLDVPPTAIVAFNDIMATGTISAARARGLETPEDLSVMGFDDTYAKLWPGPPLSTVRLPLREMGMAGLVTAVSMARGEEPIANQSQLVTSLVLRGSTGPAKKPGSP